MSAGSSSARGMAFVALMGIALAMAPEAQAGFIGPVGLPTTVTDTPTLFLGQVDYIAPGMGLATFAGGVLNWDPNGTEAPMGGGKFQIDITGRHSVGPHGEAVPGPQLVLSFEDVLAGGAMGPIITSVAHESHTDWMQALLVNVAAGRSRLYVRLDHVDDGSTPPTIDPAMFAVQPGVVPVPGSLILLVSGVGFIPLLARRPGRPGTPLVSS